VAFRSRRRAGGPQHADCLIRFGASEIVERKKLAGPRKTAGKTMSDGRRRFRRLDHLANALATTSHGGAVAACGRAGGMDLPISVAPFILCGASPFGIESLIADR
jgi:acrylyl-CoA reductase (NADPH)